MGIIFQERWEGGWEGGVLGSLKPGFLHCRKSQAILTSLWMVSLRQTSARGYLVSGEQKNWSPLGDGGELGKRAEVGGVPKCLLRLENWDP